MTTTTLSRDLLRITLGVLFIASLLIGSFWVLRPFLPALIWATMIAVATWPLTLKLQAYLGGRRGLVVLLLTIALLLVFVIPFMLAIGTIVQNADAITGGAKSLATFTVPAPPEWVLKIPLVGATIAEKWTEFTLSDQGDLAVKLGPYVGKVLNWFVSQVGNVGVLFVHFLLTVVLTAILWLQGETAADLLRRFAWRLGGERGENAARLAAQAIRAVAAGIVITALVQSVVAFIGLAIAGVPFAFLLTALIFVLSVVQVGGVPVLAPTVIWVFWKGEVGWGIFLVVWTVLVGAIDNFVRPFFIRRGANLPLLLIFAGVLGGLLGFGLIGLFVGPVVLAVSFTLLFAWIAEGDAEHIITDPATGAVQK